MSVTVLDVLDTFLGEENCLLAADLPPSRWDELVTELVRFYDAWEPPQPLTDAVFPGSWVGHHLDSEHARTVVGNDLLLFEHVVVHDPLEPFVSRYARWKLPPGAPELDLGSLPLALVNVPSQRSGQTPEIVTALYPPHVPAFMTITEAHSFNVEPFRTSYLRRALEVLESWRELVRLEAVLLAPIFEIVARRTADIVRIAQARLLAVGEATHDADDGLPLTSFYSRGVQFSPSWGAEGLARRANKRHVSWSYAREVAVCSEYGSLYAPYEDVDRRAVEALVFGDILQVSQSLSNAAATVSLPGFSDLPLEAVADLRRDSSTFHAVRDRIRAIMVSPPSELAGVDKATASLYLNEYVAAEIEAIRADAPRLEKSVGRRVGEVAVKVGFPVITGLVAGNPMAAGFAGGVGLVSQWMSRRPRTADEDAVLWIARTVDAAD